MRTIDQPNLNALAVQLILIMGLVIFIVYHIKAVLKVVPLIWETMRGLDRWLWILIVAMVPIIGAKLAVKCAEAEKSRES